MESGFCWATYLLLKVHNHLGVVKTEDLHLSLTTLELCIQKLASVN